MCQLWVSFEELQRFFCKILISVMHLMLLLTYCTAANSKINDPRVWYRRVFSPMNQLYMAMDRDRLVTIVLTTIFIKSFAFWFAKIDMGIWKYNKDRGHDDVLILKHSRIQTMTMYGVWMWADWSFHPTTSPCETAAASPALCSPCPRQLLDNKLGTTYQY